MTKPKPFDWFGWPSTPESNRRVYPHKLRDGAALAEVSALLVQLGYSHRDTWLNFPDRTGEAAGSSGLLPSDGLIVLVTRTPVRDEAKKILNCSNSRLENAIIGVARSCFETCSRDYVQLKDSVARRIQLPEHRNRSEIVFYQNHDWAWYKRLRGMRKDIILNSDPAHRKTAAYLIYVPRVQSRDLALLVAFGMGGNDTLLWARLLRERYCGRVGEVLSSGEGRFLMAELSPRQEAFQESGVGEFSPDTEKRKRSGQSPWAFQRTSDISRLWDSHLIVDCDLESSP